MRQEPSVEKLKTPEKEPEISYDILYVSHVTAKDCEKLEQAFNKPDIDVYVPEAIGWHGITLELFNKISQGELTAEQAAKMLSISQNSSRFKEFQVIEGSKKPILLVDMPEGHELIKGYVKSHVLYRESTELFYKGRFQLALEKMREHIETYSDHLLRREELIKKNLKEEIKELAKTHPELKGKEKIKALVKLGATHTGIYHDFKKEKVPVFRQFASLPRVFSNLDQAKRMIMFSKNKDVSDELLARGIIENELYHDLRKVTDHTDKLVMLKRQISSKLNLEDIAEISKQLGENPEKTLIDCLEEHNIKLPEKEKRKTLLLKA